MRYLAFYHNEKVLVDYKGKVYFTDMHMNNYPCEYGDLPCGALELDDGDLLEEDWEKLDSLVFLLKMTEGI